MSSLTQPPTIHAETVGRWPMKPVKSTLTMHGMNLRDEVKALVGHLMLVNRQDLCEKSLHGVRSWLNLLLPPHDSEEAANAYLIPVIQQATSLPHWEAAEPSLFCLRACQLQCTTLLHASYFVAVATAENKQFVQVLYKISTIVVMTCVCLNTFNDRQPCLHR